MKLELKRRWETDKSTIGELFIDGVFECYTLEDVVRPVKIPKQTAIPTGNYRVVVDFSQKFQKLMPHVLDVPNFQGIRIHPGNTDVDTEGCILVGRIHGHDFIGESRLAFAALYPKLLNEADLTITNEFQVNQPVEGIDV